MAPKKIRVGDRKIKISGESHFKEWRKEQGVQSLVDDEDYEVSDFESLEDGETYTLGPPKQQQQQQISYPGQQNPAFDVKFMLVRDNRQADGLRKLLTSAAAKCGAFYTSRNDKSQVLHGMAFKSEMIPDSLDLSSWSQSNGGVPRLLSVHLLFLSYEKVAQFEREVMILLKDKPSVALVEKNIILQSDDIDKVCIVTKVAPIEMPFPVHQSHYKPRQSESTTCEPPFDSKDECSLTVTVTESIPLGLVRNFDDTDPLWPYHAIEKPESFKCHAEKAHIFPHNECVKTKQKDEKRIKVMTHYEWLDDPTQAEFNFLYLTPDMHLCFGGSGRGLGKKAQSQPVICLEPLARTVDDGKGGKRFKIERVEKSLRATIPLRVWCRSKDVAAKLKASFAEGVEIGFDESIGLHYYDNISVQCLHTPVYMQREELLEGESKKRTFVYSKKVPLMDDKLSNAWSLTESGYMYSTEVMEKCLLWAAQKTWNIDWASTLAKREFMSRTNN